MRIVDKKGKLFGKINALDFCVIVLIIALVLGAVYKFGVMNKTKGSVTMQPISYTVLIEKVRNVAMDNVQIGDVLYDKTSGNFIGKITNVESTPAKDKIKNLDGTVTVGEVENRINLKLTVEAEGTISDEGYFVNKTYELLVGAKKKFVTKYFDCEGSVGEIL